jgi:hypothetical protein
VAITLAGLITLMEWTQPQPEALTWPPEVSAVITIAAIVLWTVAWWRYSTRVNELEKMVVDQREAEYWIGFRASVAGLKAQQSNLTGPAGEVRRTPEV